MNGSEDRPDRWNGTTLSVVLPNYNHADLIARALDALLAQDRPADEIIIIDDGSTDDSLSVIQAYAARAPAIRILRNDKNCGIVATLQRGLEAARGRYVYFAASDDWVLPGFFALALALLEGYPQRGFFCGEAILVDGVTGGFRGLRPIARPRSGRGDVSPSRAVELLARIDNWILTGSAVFRRECVVATGGFDTRLGSFADSYLSRKIALTRGFCYAPVTVATWCIFSGSVSRVTALQRAEEVLAVVPSVIAADPTFPSWYPEAFRRRWRFAASRLALESRPVDRALVSTMGAASPLDRLALKTIWAVLPAALGRFATLTLLWWRWRPTSLRFVVTTALERRLEGRLRGRPPPTAPSLPQERRLAADVRSSPAPADERLR
ncbi:MAG: glycosyltransferase family 2 protein [Methylobacteriaceae bacterium]|nr:glycosyltransferase family 2 protein [Methylobacteriaceae bacterium]